MSNYVREVLRKSVEGIDLAVEELKRDRDRILPRLGEIEAELDLLARRRNELVAELQDREATS